MGNKQLKNRKPVGSAVDINLLNALKEYSEQSKIPMSKLLDEAIILLCKEYNVDFRK